MTEPKVLPADEMLRALRKRAADLRAEIGFAKGELSHYEGIKAMGAIAWADERIAIMNGAKAERDAELAALEQAIACLETMADPKFIGLENNSGAAYSAHVNVSSGKHAWTTVMGSTPMEALLKAHEALYPSTPAKTETEDIPHGE